MGPTDTGLLAGYDLDTLREKIARPPFDAVFRTLVEQVHATAERDRQTEVIPAGGWCHSQYFTPRVLDAGFVHAMTGDAVAAAHVARQIDKVARVYADPPASFAREIKGFSGKPTAYFTNAHTCLAARMCRAELSDASYAKLCDLARHRLIDDHHKPVYFFTHFNAGHNAVTTHVISGAICALTFGREVRHPDTERIIEWGRDACEHHVHWAYDDQGAPHEGPMYSLVTLQWVFLYADLLRRHGGEDLFKTLPKLERIAQTYTELQLPGIRGCVGFDDCRRLIEQVPMPWLLQTERAYGRPQDRALWADSLVEHFDGHRNIQPTWMGLMELLWWDGRMPDKHVRDFDPPTAYFGMGKAVAMLRTSWSDEAVCLTVLGQGRSHNVPDHTHADAGHFCIHAYGDYLAYDTAYFNFDEDTHSVMLIDDTPFHHATQGNQYAGRFERAEHTDWLDCVQVDAAAAKGCMWAKRIVLFVRCDDDDAYVIVADNINVDNQTHNYKWQLQANMHTRIDVTGEHTATVHGSTARLDCHFFKPAPDDYPGHAHTMSVRADDHQHLDVLTKQPQTNPRLVAELVGPNGTMLAAIIPRRRDDAALTVTDASDYRTWNITIAHGDYVDQIVYAADHTHVRLEDLHGSSECIAIRRDRNGKVIKTWSIDGKPVRAR